LIFNIVLGDRKTVKVFGNREAVKAIFSPEDDTPFPRMPPIAAGGAESFLERESKEARK